MPTKNPHAVALGRRGGKVKSTAKTRAAQRNGVISAYKRKLRREALDKALRSA